MITVIDYGMGNLRSVSKALEHLGARVRVSDQAADIESTDQLVLPGVGAFGDAVRELQSRNLTDAIRTHIDKEKPFLGICLGLQVLFEASEEASDVPGLGIIPGIVKRFQSQNVKIPHMGWNSVQLNQHPLLNGIDDESYFYFVHTFYAVPENDSNILGSCHYGNETFSAIVGNKNAFATQFHPEKSQKAGLKILENFIRN